MSVKVNGDKEILAYIEKKYGTAGRKKMESAAITKGGNVLKNNMKDAFYPYRDTGYTVTDMNLYGPNKKTGSNRAKLNWQGPHQRYKLMHLNEYGHFMRNGKFLSPRQTGLIENTTRASRDSYRKAIKEELEKRV